MTKIEVQLEVDRILDLNKMAVIEDVAESRIDERALKKVEARSIFSPTEELLDVIILFCKEFFFINKLGNYLSSRGMIFISQLGFWLREEEARKRCKVEQRVFGIHDAVQICSRASELLDENERLYFFGTVVRKDTGAKDNGIRYVTVVSAVGGNGWGIGFVSSPSTITKESKVPFLAG